MKSLEDYWIEEQYFKLRYELDFIDSGIPIKYDNVDDWRELS